MIYRRAFYGEALGNAALLLGVIGGLTAMVLMGRLVTDTAYLTAGSTLLLLLLQLIKYLPQLVSASLFAALVVTFNRMVQSRELASWSMVGLRRRHWLGCTLALSLPSALAVLLLALYGAPWSIRFADSYQRELASTLKLEQTSPGIFGEIKAQDLVFHLGALSPDRKQALNIFIARATAAQAFQIASAAKADTTIDAGGVRSLALYQGQLNVIDFASEASSRIEFAASQFNLGQASEQSQVRRRALAPSELRRSDANRVELYWRLGFGPALVLLALLAFALGRLSPNSGKGYQVVLAILVYWFYTALAGFVRDLGFAGELAPWAAGALPPGLLGLCVALALGLLAPQRLR